MYIVGGLEENKEIIILEDEHEMEVTGEGSLEQSEQGDTEKSTPRMREVKRIETPEESVRSFFTEKLKMKIEDAKNISLKNVQRIGVRRNHRNRNILVEFCDNNDKECVKSFRKNLEDTDIYMHDQYPPEIVALRKQLVPIMKKARADKKNAYIRYNRLIVEGSVYTDGPYGRVPA